MICTAFIFRLLFINAGIISSTLIPDTKPATSHFSKTMKRRKSTEFPQHSNPRETSAIEICEESTSEDELLKTTLPGFSHLFYSMNSRPIAHLNPFFPDLRHYKLSTRKHIEVSVLRI